MQPRSVKKSVWSKFLLCFQLRIWFLNAVCNTQRPKTVLPNAAWEWIFQTALIILFFFFFATVQNLSPEILHWVTAVFDLISKNITLNPESWVLSSQLHSPGHILGSHIPPDFFYTFSVISFCSGGQCGWGRRRLTPTFGYGAAPVKQHEACIDVQQTERVKVAQLKSILAVIFSDSFLLWICNKSLLFLIY